MSKQKIKIESKVSRLIHFMDMIRNGQVKIPSFQRDFIWTNRQKIKLFESIKEEYPIGTILLWKPDAEFSVKDTLGPFTVAKRNTNFFYILDGFQRLSTLFGCLTNPSPEEFEIDKELLSQFAMQYDLEKEEFNIPRNRQVEITNLPVYKLLDTFGFLDFSDELRSTLDNKEDANKLIGRAKQLSSTLIDYQLPYIEIHGGDIKQAVNIFSRVNSTGTPISSDWMVSALTSNEATGFNLGEIIEDLLTNLKTYNFEDLKREIVLQCIQTAFGKLYIDEKIEDLIKRKDFAKRAKKTVESIEKAVKFLFEELLVLERKLLPYNNQLIYLSYFFNEVENPTEEQKEVLKKWFWVTTYATYFTIYALSKIRTSFDYFKDFVEGKRDNPIYNDRPDTRFQVAEFPTKNINLGSVRSTALILFLLNYSNDFKPVKAEEIEGFELQYLVSSGKIPENIIPLIKHVNHKKDMIKGKHKNIVSFIKSDYSDQNLPKQFTKLFIDKQTNNLEKASILNIRKAKIIAEEKEFVTTKLKLDYLTMGRWGLFKNVEFL